MEEPASGPYSVDVLNQTHGSAEIASENSIIDSIKLLAETEGIFTETAGGVVISSLKELVKKGKIKKDETVVAFITGNGLKTLESMGEIKENTVSCMPNISSFDLVKSNFKI